MLRSRFLLDSSIYSQEYSLLRANTIDFKSFLISFLGNVPWVPYAFDTPAQFSGIDQGKRPDHKEESNNAGFGTSKMHYCKT